jgi:hypothetical protein
VKVFAFTPEGKLFISPVMNDSLAEFKLMDCVDEMGHKPFEKALRELKNKDSVWEIFLAKNRYQRRLVKKSSYLRKTFVVGIALFFGLSTAFLPSLYVQAPKLIQTFFTDPLPTATILAVILNQVFNLDILYRKIIKRD